MDAKLSGVIGSSGGGLIKTGTGILQLTNANTYTGATQVSAGTLSLDNNNTTTARLANTSNITVNSGGTLLLAQSGGTSSIDRVNDSATITLNGGTFNTGGLSEYTVGSVKPGIGALTLSSSSIIDLASGASILAFANSSGPTWSGTLSIYNWSGTLIAGNGTDQVYFGTDNTGLTGTQLGQISFYSGAGTGFLGSATWGSDLDGEVVPLAPVPEPSTWIAAALAVGVVGWSVVRKKLKPETA